MKKYRLSILLVVLAGLFLIACERNIDIDFPPGEDILVVEGSIENGQPPFVILTKGLPFLGSTSAEQFKDFFVRGATVTISDGTQTVQLLEYTIDSIQGAAGTFYTVDTAKLPFVMVGVAGKTYTLTVKYDNETYTATTQIPNPVALDSIVPKPSDPKDPLDTLRELECYFKDPDTLGNYYRGYTKRNKEFFYDTPYFSVYDDNLVNGATFHFTMFRNKRERVLSDTVDGRTARFFQIGDTVYVKWCSIDRNTYNFWRTYESQNISFGNPFTSTVVLNSNIKGNNATGIWAGYGAKIYQVIVK